MADTGDAPASDPAATPEPLTGHAWALWVLSGFAGVGLALSMLCAGLSASSQKWPAAFAASLICGASMALGGFLGFLFGIPRTASATDAEHDPTSGAAKTDGERTRRALYLPNTNLEQISDWLTKILVGVGLTQIGSLPAKLDLLAGYNASSFGGSKAMALAVLVYFSLEGFLIGFLWTRLYLPRALRDADGAEKLEAVRKQVDSLQRAKENEQQIFGLVERQLSPDAPPASVDELAEAMGKASRAELVQIFYRASGVRTTTWRDPLSKPLMERTIPIFRALIKVDPGYYRTHGQLGFALKDAREPNWSEALRELTIAIELRDKEEIGGPNASISERSAPWYEYVRAQCRINLDPNFHHNRPSDSVSRDAILADIEAAKQLGSKVVDDEDISRWARINNVVLVP